MVAGSPNAETETKKANRKMAARLSMILLPQTPKYGKMFRLYCGDEDRVFSNTVGDEPDRGPASGARTDISADVVDGPTDRREGVYADGGSGCGTGEGRERGAGVRRSAVVGDGVGCIRGNAQRETWNAK